MGNVGGGLKALWMAEGKAFVRLTVRRDAAETQPRLRELSYDANGNHKQWKYRGSVQRTLSWDEDHRLVSVNENGQERSRALYDGAGERRVHLHRVAGEEETAYVDQHLVVRNGVIATKHL